MGEGFRVVKRMPTGFRERFSLKPDTQGIQRGPSKASGLQRLEGELLEEILIHPSLVSGQPMEVSQVVTHT